MAYLSYCLRFPILVGNRRNQIAFAIFSVLLILAAGRGAWICISRHTKPGVFHQCFNYSDSENTVVFEGDAIKAQLLKQDSAYSFSNPVPAYKISDELIAFESAVGTLGLHNEATLFMHERYTPDGRRRLVIVTFAIAHSPEPLSVYILDPDRALYVSAAWRFGNPQFWPATYSCGESCDFRIYAGQPDSSSLSDFVVRYECNGVRGRLHGSLQNTERLALTTTVGWQ